MNVEESWQFIKKLIKRALNKFIPLQKNNPRSLRNKWCTSGILKSIKKKQSLYAKYKRTRDLIDYQSYAKIRNEVTMKIKKAKLEQEKKISNESKGSPKKFWQYVNRNIKNRAHLGPLVSNDKIVNLDTEKAELLNTYFSSVYTIENKTDVPVVNSKCEKASEGWNLEIEERDVRDRLRVLDALKAFGPDGIPPRILKECYDELAGPITVLFRKSLERGILPSDWHRAIVTAIFKKGVKTNPAQSA